MNINCDWLFSCVLDLYLNLSCLKLSKEVMNVYKKKFNKFYGDFLNSDELTDSQIIDKIIENIKKEEERKKDKNSEKNDYCFQVNRKRGGCLEENKRRKQQRKQLILIKKDEKNRFIDFL